MAFPTTFLSMQNAIMSRIRIPLDTTNRDRVKDRINQAYADLSIETEAIQGVGTVTFTINESSYLIDANVIRIKMLIVKQASQTDYGPPLASVSLDDLLNKRMSGVVPAVNNGMSTNYALLGAGQIEFWPTPTTADTAKYYYVKLPTALSNDADVLDARIFPEPYPRAVEYAALYEEALHLKDPNLSDIERQRDMWLAKFRRHLSRRLGGGTEQFRVAGQAAPPTWDNSRDLVW